MRYTIIIEDPKGFPETISNDLKRVQNDHADECRIEYNEDADTVTITIGSSNAGKWLYDWLEETREYYQREYVDASMEHDAARQMADVVYEQFKDPKPML